jgi:hypothetical protein
MPGTAQHRGNTRQQFPDFEVVIDDQDVDLVGHGRNVTENFGQLPELFPPADTISLSISATALQACTTIITARRKNLISL